MDEILISHYGTKRWSIVDQPDISTTIGSVKLPNIIMPASGCFGPELAEIIDTSDIGAVVTKTIFHDARAGNPADRVYDLAYGMLNSVGIPSPGIDVFNREILPQYSALGTKVVVSVGGLTDSEYVDALKNIDPTGIDFFEINISCPNLEHDGLPIAASAEHTASLISSLRPLTSKPLVAKLTPLVADIQPIAVAAEEAGVDAVTISNSVPGLAINISKQQAVLGNTTGGYTGPGIKPIILYLVHQAAQAINIPIIGCGGINFVEDVIEYLLAGAHAVQVGTATFTNPHTMNNLVNDLKEYCVENRVSSVSELIGALKS